MILLSNNLKFLREKLNLSQGDFGALFQCSRDNIMSYERGTEPKLKTLQIIVNYFHITIDTLINIEFDSHWTLHRDQDGNVHLICPPNSPPISKSEKLGGQNVEVIGGANHRGNSKSQNLALQKFKGLSVVREEMPTYADNVAVEIVDVKAAANVQGLSIHEGHVENIGVLPVPRLLLGRNAHKQHFWFPIIGDSMEPTIYIDDYILGCQVQPHEYHEIKDNFIYIISTRDHGIMLKRILNRLDSRGQLYAKSDNRSYSGFNIDHSDIVSVWYAVARLSFKFPNEQINLFNIYKDLESRIEMLEGKK